jgi:hypothetical protein
LGPPLQPQLLLQQGKFIIQFHQSNLIYKFYSVKNLPRSRQHFL